MKSKLFFITTFLFLQGQSLFSQCISVELSVTWEVGYDIFNKDSTRHVSMLNITYRNNCNVNYYFLKVSESKNSLPPVSCTIMFNYPYEYYLYPDYLKRAKTHLNYASQDFNVRIGGVPYYSNCWDILSDTANYDKVHASDVINCDLEDIYAYIRYDKNLEDFTKKSPNGVYKLDFEPSDVLPENILDSVKNQFIFLKSRETYIDTYNLVGFQIVEGCYTFFIDQEDIKNYVLSNQYDSKLKKNVDQELELPEVVGEYQLYSGGFNTNKVTVCFGER